MNGVATKDDFIEFKNITITAGVILFCFEIS